MAFNIQMLTLARQARGLSQAGLSKKADISQGQLSKIENKQHEPSLETIQKLADALNYPSSLFEQSDQIYGLPMSLQPLYRKKASISQKILGRVQAEINLRLLHLRRLLRSMELEAPLPLPDMDPDLYGSPEEIAQKLRRVWQMPDGPVEDLAAWVEDAGLIIMEVDFDDASIAGVSYSVPDLPKSVFLDQAMVADRWRFSLAHELAHAIMHRLPRFEGVDMEEEANRFAAELLMPAAEIKRELRGKIDLKRLARLKPKWKVAISALLYRSQQLGVISKNQAQYLWRQMNAMGIRMREPTQYDFAPEKPQAMENIFKYHLQELDYSPQELAKSLNVYEEELVRLYPSFWPGLLGRRLTIV